MDELLERRVGLIPPGEPDLIPTWVSCRSIPAIEAGTDRMVAALESPGSARRRLEDVQATRATLRQELDGDAGLGALIDRLTSALLVHWVDMLRAHVLGSGRSGDEQVQSLKALGRLAGALCPWDDAAQARAGALVREALDQLERRAGARNA